MNCQIPSGPLWRPCIDQPDRKYAICNQKGLGFVKYLQSNCGFVSVMLHISCSVKGGPQQQKVLDDSRMFSGNPERLKEKKLQVEFFFAVEIHILYTVQSATQYFDLVAC